MTSRDVPLSCDAPRDPSHVMPRGTFSCDAPRDCISRRTGNGLFLSVPTHARSDLYECESADVARCQSRRHLGQRGGRAPDPKRHSMGPYHHRVCCDLNTVPSLQVLYAARAFAGATAYPVFEQLVCPSSPDEELSVTVTCYSAGQVAGSSPHSWEPRLR